MAKRLGARLPESSMSNFKFSKKERGTRNFYFGFTTCVLHNVCGCVGAFSFEHLGTEKETHPFFRHRERRMNKGVLRPQNKMIVFLSQNLSADGGVHTGKVHKK